MILVGRILIWMNMFLVVANAAMIVFDSFSWSRTIAIALNLFSAIMLYDTIKKYKEL